MANQSLRDALITAIDQLRLRGGPEDLRVAELCESQLSKEDANKPSSNNPPVIPAGYWLAPDHPDNLMMRAGFDKFCNGNDVFHIYRAMRDDYVKRHPIGGSSAPSQNQQQSSKTSTHDLAAA